MQHESELHRASCTLTLTYNDESLPENGSLRYSHVQSFLKRLRHELVRSPPAPQHALLRPLKFYAAGEYGEQEKRPHYHLVIFGWDFPDKYEYKIAPSGHPLYRSPQLEELWTHGHSSVGTLTFQSAQYAAKYASKVVNVSKASSERAYRRYEQRYTRVDASTGELVQVEPEFARMSLRPALGYDWFQRFWKDVYPSDSVIVDGKERPPPRYYDKLLERKDPKLYELVKRKRLEERNRDNDSRSRHAAMESCALARNSLHGDRN